MDPYIGKVWRPLFTHGIDVCRRLFNHYTILVYRGLCCHYNTGMEDRILPLHKSVMEATNKPLKQSDIEAPA
jgi:hypothetical protein